MLSKLHITGLKGADKLTVPLTAITLLHGAVQTGKTRILDAATLALLGHIPALGKQPGKTRQLAVPTKTLQVVAEREGHPPVTQTWPVKGAYSVIPAETVFAPAAMLDLTDFWAMTGAARTAYLLERCGLGAPDDSLPSHIRDVILLSGQDDAFKGTVEQLKVCAGETMVHLKSLGAELPGSVAGVLKLVNDLLVVKRRAAKATAESVRGSIQQLEAQAASQGMETPTDHSVELKAAKELLRVKSQERTRSQTQARTLKVEEGRILNDGKSLKQQRDQLKALSKCPTCGEPDCGCWTTSQATSLAALDTQLQPLRQQLESTRASLAELQPAVEKLTVEEAAQEQVVNALEQRQRLFTASQGAARQMEQIRRQQDDAESLAKSLDAAVKAIEAETERTTKTGVASILTRANLLVRPVMGLELAYEDGDFGYWKDGQWVNYRTMSGSERLLTFGGLQLAFTMDWPERVLLMDELGRVDPPHKRQLVATLAGLIAEQKLHQFIGVDLESDWFGDEEVIALMDPPDKHEEAKLGWLTQNVSLIEVTKEGVKL